jgi:hypothetical protein
MKLSDESELRDLLAAYEVCEPPVPLVERTMHLMREELALCTAAVPAWQQRWLLALFAPAVLLALSLFYMLSIGTILRMVIPPQFTVYLVHSLYAFTAAEVCLIAGTIMVLFLRQLQPGRSRFGRVTA